MNARRTREDVIGGIERAGTELAGPDRVATGVVLAHERINVADPVSS